MKDIDRERARVEKLTTWRYCALAVAEESGVKHFESEVEQRMRAVEIARTGGQLLTRSTDKLGRRGQDVETR